MRPHLRAGSLLSLAAAACFAVPPAHALDDAIRAQLTWTANDSTDLDLESTTPPSRLFIMLTGGVESFKGAEFDITWIPAGDGRTCFPNPSMIVSPATDCTYLNRGTIVPIVTINQPGHLHAAWGNSESNQSCSSGTIVEIQMDFTGCADPRRVFTLNQLAVLDSLNVQHVVTRRGVPATVFGGIGNHPPVLTPIPDFATSAGTALTVPLTGADPDGDSLTFSLASIDPPPSGAPPLVTTDSPTMGTLRWRPALADTGVAFSIAVQADDSRGGVARDTFVVTVTSNQPPRIVHIPDMNVQEGQLLTVLITGIDPDGDAMTFSLGGVVPPPPSGVLPTVQDSTPTLGVMRWTPSAGDAGQYRVGLRVEDGRGGVGTELFRVSVTRANNPPVIQEQPDTTIVEGVTSLITLHASDPDSLDTARIQWSLRPPAPPWASLSPTTGGTTVLTCMPGFQSADSTGSGGVGQDIITLLVSDRRRGHNGLLDTMQFVLSISNVNHPPTIEPVPWRTIRTGETLVLILTGADPDGDPLHFSLQSIDPEPPSGPPVVTDSTDVSGLLAWTPTDADTGSYTVAVNVDDGHGASASTSFQLTVQVDNDPPVFSPIPPSVATGGRTLVRPVSAADADGDPIQFSFSSITPLPPSGMLPTVQTNSPTAGAITWTPAVIDTGLTYAIDVLASDGRGGQATATASVTVVSNQPPSIDQLPYRTVDVGQPLVVALSGSDPDGEALHFSLASMIPPPPSGVLPAVTDSGATAGTLTWTPQALDAGLTTTVTVLVEDPHGAAATAWFTVQVFFIPGNQDAYAQLSWSPTDPTQTNLPAPVTTADLYIDLPSGVTGFKGAEFDITWGPAGNGFNCRTQLGVAFPTSSGTVCTYLNRGSAVPVTTVDDPSHLHVAWANTIANTSCTAGSILRVPFDFSGCADPATTFTLNSLILLDENNLSWSVAFDHLGIAATVGGASANHPPTIDPLSGRSMNVGAVLVVGLTGHDVDGDSLHFSLLSIAPPPAGATPTVSDSGGTFGTLTWSPAAMDAGATYSLTVQAQDPLGGVASTTFTVSVAGSGLQAQLSWSPTDFGLTDLTTPGALNNLYIDMTSGVQTFKGAEFDVTWDPPGNGVDCRAHLSTLYRTSSGTTCTYLNRGSAVPIVTADDPGHLHIAWANSLANTSCAAGAIVAIQLEFDGEECTDTRTTFTLTSLALLDANNGIIPVAAENLGTPATVLGGATAGVRKGGRPTLPRITASLTTGLHVTPTLVASGAQVTYAIERDAPVDVAVFASDGRRVRTLDSGARAAGEYGVTWDGRGDNASPIARGVYYVRAVLGDRRFAERIVLLR